MFLGSAPISELPAFSDFSGFIPNPQLNIKARLIFQLSPCVNAGEILQCLAGAKVQQLWKQ